MIKMTLSSRHRIRNSSPGGLRPSTLPLGHGGSPQYWLSHVDGEETIFVSFKPPRPGTEPRTLTWKAAVLTTTLGPPPSLSSTTSAFSCETTFWRFFWPWCHHVKCCLTRVVKDKIARTNPSSSSRFMKFSERAGTFLELVQCDLQSRKQ